ncbi:hypothetical protein KW797_02150 [Candidatus Parcubacteria bacterium]|nr:hypothetical protein [Candidatus Parcubacteria bacterium]
MNPQDPTPRWKRLLPTKPELLLTFKSFSRRERWIFFALGAFFLVSVLYALGTLNGVVSLNLPAYGGELTEGILGTPRFVNPVLALTDADRDISTLVYAGLLKKTPEGDLVPELASAYEISDDGLTYTFHLRDDIYFHDGVPVTADDIEFTVGRVKDPLVKSPRRGAWEGVTFQKVDDKTVKFTLRQKYFLFLETATIGILPKHLWKDLTPEQFSFSDFNTEGVGAGPYRIVRVNKNSSGIPASYELHSFDRYALGRPYIDKLVVRFYPNQAELVTAFDNGIVENANSVDAKQASVLRQSGYRVLQTSLPRIFGVFFNQNQNQIFADKAVRRALGTAVDKEGIIESVLFGYGTAIDSPLPGYSSEEKRTATSTRATDARKMLEAAGWTWNEQESVMEKKVRGKPSTKLSFSLSTGDVPELKEAARLLKEDFERAGAKVELKMFDVGDLNQNVIRPRKYDALFFGEIVGFDADPLPFWHSSQRNDPGLNIALYTNAKADKLLEELRGTQDESARRAKYAAFEAEIANDQPAIFVYSPDFVYLVSERLKGLTLSNVTVPSDRFLGVKDWYLATDQVWKVFTRFTTR